MVLLPTVWVAHQGYSLWVDVMWMLSAAGLLLVTLGVDRRWLQPGLTAQDFWPAMPPALLVNMLAGVALFFTLLSFTVLRRCLFR